VAALVGIQNSVIGYDVTLAERVLYLALDRPSQIRRAMRRLYREADRDALDARLVVWKGPLPADLGKRPSILLELAVVHGCDVVVVDSLKDAAVKITDDEVGGNVNRALQICLAEGVDVLALHHQRKGQGGNKPTSLEDVYGSTWVVAGAGSVVLLWGDAGSELVELTHLKQPADPVGPLHLEHDHHAGVTAVTHGWDPFLYLCMRGDVGATLVEAAQAEHATAVVSDAKKKRTERKLRALEQRGMAKSRRGERQPDGTLSPVRWWATDDASTTDTTTDTAVSE
jgi:hypothetical protein